MGDKDGYKRGAKGIDGEGKPLAKAGPQRFQKYVISTKEQAATAGKVTKHIHSGEGKPRDWGIDAGSKKDWA